MKKLFSFFICLSMFFPTSLFSLDEQNEDLSQYSYSVSDDENFQDGVMSNPDGYEGTGYVTENNSQSQISKSMARGSGYNLTWGYENALAGTSIQEDTLLKLDGEYSVISENEFYNPGEDPTILLEQIVFSQNNSYRFSPIRISQVKSIQ